MDIQTILMVCGFAGMVFMGGRIWQATKTSSKDCSEIKTNIRQITVELGKNNERLARIEGWMNGYRSLDEMNREEAKREANRKLDNCR